MVSCLLRSRPCRLLHGGNHSASFRSFRPHCRRVAGHVVQLRCNMEAIQQQLRLQARTQRASSDDGRRFPVLLFDVMGTLVSDPFYTDMAGFFGMSMKELLSAKHPTAWIEFEKGLLTEEQLVATFFEDGREFNYSGLKDCMAGKYGYLDGVESLLQRLKGAGYEMHAFTNYPCWYRMIEEKLKLSEYLAWTFVSCEMGVRKPDQQAYARAVQVLDVLPSSCIFVDDRQVNVAAAAEAGMTGILFESAAKLEQDLATYGVLLE